MCGQSNLCVSQRLYQTSSWARTFEFLDWYFFPVAPVIGRQWKRRGRRMWGTSGLLLSSVQRARLEGNFQRKFMMLESMQGKVYKKNKIKYLIHFIIWIACNIHIHFEPIYAKKPDGIHIDLSNIFHVILSFIIASKNDRIGNPRTDFEHIDEYPSCLKHLKTTDTRITERKTKRERTNGRMTKTIFCFKYDLKYYIVWNWCMILCHHFCINQSINTQFRNKLILKFKQSIHFCSFLFISNHVSIQRIRTEKAQ